MKGRFITFEGGEGGGKSSQIPLLAERLRQQGREVILTREPGGSPMAERIRALLVTGEPGALTPMGELLLMEAARAQHVAELIRPALQRGAWVVCDRFTDSTTAYQGFGRGLPMERIQSLNQWATEGRQPDLTLLLDLDPVMGLARAKGRAGTEVRFEAEALEFHQRVRQGFLTLAEREPERFVVVDATQPLERVAEAVWQGVERMNDRI